MRVKTDARSATDIRGHGPSSKAFRAATTAALISVSVGTGTEPITSSVNGDTAE
jgi:hypothetical protein